MRLAAALGSLLLVGCPQLSEVVFEVHTDLELGASFDRIEASSDHGSTRTSEVADYRRGVRLPSLFVPPGRVRFEIAARRGSSAVLSRELDLLVRDRHLVPVYLLAACSDRVCPQPGDASDATECEGGRCIPPECSRERPDLCPAPACTGDGDCTAITTSCGASFCEEGLCVFRPRSGGCPATEVCDPTLGCVPRSSGLDAGSPDAGFTSDVPSRPDVGADVGCAAGLLDCDGNPTNGCEASLDDVTTCGSCANDCTAGAHVTGATCMAGTCSALTCDADFGDCNTDPSDGCETSLLDAANCGWCGHDCLLDGQVVAAFCIPSGGTPTCSYTCRFGWGDCGGGLGCETMLGTTSNCSRCYEFCTAGRDCCSVAGCQPC